MYEDLGREGIGYMDITDKKIHHLLLKCIFIRRKI